MTNPPVGVERRIGQRFPFNFPVSLRDVATAADGVGFTQDLSSRGAFLVTDMALREGAEVELTLKMPSEITLGENMRVRCRGVVLRIVTSADQSYSSVTLADANSGDIKAETQFGDRRLPKGLRIPFRGREWLRGVPADFGLAQPC